MAGSWQTLSELLRQMRAARGLEPLLATVAERAAGLLETPRTSVRLLDATGERLLGVARAGTPLHRDALYQFRLGEGLVGWVAREGQTLRVARAEADPRFVPRDDQQEPLGSFLGVPIQVASGCIGVLSAAHPEPEGFSDEHERMLEVLAALCAPHLELARLRRLAHVDPLTGALNRRGMDEASALGLDVSHPAVAVVAVDIDGFKAVNDRLGHATGDLVLREVTRVLANTVRSKDQVVRMGGEEFLLILPDATLAQAAAVAERARATIAATTVVSDARPVAVSCSFGVAARADDETREALLARADRALYVAKERGGDRVELAAAE